MPRKGTEPGAKAKLRKFFMEHQGEVLTSDQLRAVAGTSEWARRVRELRNEEGMNIQTHHDQSELSPGQYVLVDIKPLPAFAREISKEVRAYVLERNGYTCQMCGAAAGEPHPYDPTRRVRLHLGHVLDKSLGGTDEASNLRAVCSVCNEGAANITPMPPALMHVLVQVRRMPVTDQLKVMEWLFKKFPQRAAQLAPGK